MNDIKKQAIEHYHRMIEFAKKQNYTDMSDSYVMEIAIGEGWSGNDCSYCDEYLGLTGCNKCPLNAGFCCSHLWMDMNCSYTWGEWIDNAYKVLQYIKDNG